MPRIEFGRAVNSIKSAFKEEDAEARAEKIVEEIKTGVNCGFRLIDDTLLFVGIAIWVGLIIFWSFCIYVGWR